MFKLQHSEMLEVDTNDFQHRVERLIRDHKNDDGFPQLTDYEILEDELDDYLFDYQAILDSKGSERSRYTIALFLIALPVIVMSAFPEESLPWGGWSILVAVGIGLGLFFLYLGIQKAILKGRATRLNAERKKVKQYVDDVLKFGDAID